MPVPCLLLHLLLPPPPRHQLAMHQGRRRYQEDRAVCALGLRIPFLAEDSQLAGLTVLDSARRGRSGNSEKMVLWVFGYGSLVWNPGFEFDEKIVGYIKDYKRVFDLACIDHRGTPENPARTCTLEAKKEEICGVKVLQAHSQVLFCHGYNVLKLLLVQQRVLNTYMRKHPLITVTLSQTMYYVLMIMLRR